MGGTEVQDEPKQGRTDRWSCAGTPGSERVEGELEIPKGWKTLVDPSGRNYYENTVQQYTQWVKPTKPAAQSHPPSTKGREMPAAEDAPLPFDTYTTIMGLERFEIPNIGEATRQKKMDEANKQFVEAIKTADQKNEKFWSKGFYKRRREDHEKTQWMARRHLEVFKKAEEERNKVLDS